MGIKNAEFYADFEYVEKFWKNALKKVTGQNVKEICSFFTFTHVRQTLLITFFVHF